MKARALVAMLLASVFLLGCIDITVVDKRLGGELIEVAVVTHTPSAQAAVDLSPSTADNPPPTKSYPPTATSTATRTLTPTNTSTATQAPTPTSTPTATRTHTPTTTSTSTDTPTTAPSPTTAMVSVKAPTLTPAPTSPSPLPPPMTPGGRIAFSVIEPGTSIRKAVSIRPDGSDLRWLGDHLRQPCYRQDGAKIIANGEGGGMDDLWILDADGSRVQAMGQLDDEHPVWIQSRSYHVAFDSLRWGDGQWHLYLGDNAISYGSGPILGRYPIAIPGDQIVYNGCNYGFGNGSRCGLYKVSIWGGIPCQLSEEAGDMPTGGGSAGVLFMRQKDGNWDVYLMAADGGNSHPLTSHAAQDGLATFSPDGRTIAFLSDRSGGWAIWLMNRDGSNQRKVYDLPRGSYGAEWTSERLSWGPLPATPTPVPTPISASKEAAPTFIWPRPEDVIEADRPYVIQWSWGIRSLNENEGFEVRLRTSLDSAPAALAAPNRDTSLGVTFAYSPIYDGPGYYYLDVVVVQISPWKELSQPAGPIRIRLED